MASQVKLTIKDHANAIRPMLLGEFEKMLFEAVLANLNDVTNPLRVNNFAYSMRELVRVVLSRLAKDDDIKKTKWFKVAAKGKDEVTRKMRIKYAIHGGLPSGVATSQYKVNVKKICTCLADQIDTLSKYTHINEHVFPLDDKEDVVALEMLSSVSKFFEEIYACREALASAIDDSISDTVVNELLMETITSIDSLAMHHSVDEIYVDSRHVEILSDHILVHVNGSVYVTLQWGSNSDMRNDMGAEVETSFPFRATLCGQLYRPSRLELVDGLGVDTSKWTDDYYDES